MHCVADDAHTTRVCNMRTKTTKLTTWEMLTIEQALANYAAIMPDADVKGALYLLGDAIAKAKTVTIHN